MQFMPRASLCLYILPPQESSSISYLLKLRKNLTVRSPFSHLYFHLPDYSERGKKAGISLHIFSPSHEVFSSKGYSTPK